MFEVGNYIVYKKEVCKIKEKKIYGEREYYVLLPLDDNSLTINVPCNTTLIRKLMNKKDVDLLIAKIPSIKLLETINEKNIEQEYKQLLSQGCYEDLIKIIKTTYVRNNNRLKNNKKIGEKDDYYFNVAEKILYNEFAIVLNKTFDETKKYVIQQVKNSLK